MSSIKGQPQPGFSQLEHIALAGSDEGVRVGVVAEDGVGPQADEVLEAAERAEVGGDVDLGPAHAALEGGLDALDLVAALLLHEELDGGAPLQQHDVLVVAQVRRQAVQVVAYRAELIANRNLAVLPHHDFQLEHGPGFRASCHTYIK